MTAIMDFSTVVGTRQFLRFTVVSACVNLSGYLAYLALTYSGLDPKISATTVFLLAMCLGFASHRRWTFRNSADPRRAFVRYVLTYVSCLGLNVLALYVFVDLLHYRHEFVQAVVILFNVGTLFPLQRFWIFPVSPLRERFTDPGSTA